MIQFNKFIKRNLASVANLNTTSYKVLIIGGGTAGISVSSNLSKYFEKGEVGIIEPNDKHYYQPLWTFVGAGLKSIEESYKPTSEIIPNKVNWIKNKVQKIEPDNNHVILSNGDKVNYEYLIVAPGIEIKWNKVEGLKNALDNQWVCSNYSADTVESTFTQLNKLNKGNAVFTMPSTPIKCAGAPQKIAYLSDSYLRQKGVRDQINISYHTGIGKIFAIEKYAKTLLEVSKQKNIDLNYNQNLVEVKQDKLIFKDLIKNEFVEKDYNFAHITPPMGPYEFLKDSKLVNQDGYVDVNKENLIHTKYSNVLSLGDASSLPTSKTAAAITTQSKVISQNLIKLYNNQKDYLNYDGYTSCPLLVGDNKLVLAEFSGYTAQPLETLPYDQSKPSKLSYFLTAEVLPKLYWEGLLKGRWQGPEQVRKLFKLVK